MGAWIYPRRLVNLEPYAKTGGVDIGGSKTSLAEAIHVEYTLLGVEAERITYPYYECCPDDSDWPVVFYTVRLRRASIIYTFKILVPQV
jgi:hypothetical protein